MHRRTVLAAAVAALTAPRTLCAQSITTLRFIPQTDVTALDPVWSSAYVTRNHAYLVFDTLYGQDSKLGAQPQMVEGHTIGDNGRLWRLTLRPGLMFHDNTPVLARDCIASIRRWAKRDGFGQILAAATEELSAPDDRTIQFRLRAPFPLLPDALGKIGGNMLPIMPERLATTDAFKQVPEIVGSGPYRFLPDERIVGSRLAYAKFDGYTPRPNGTPEWTTGPKVVHFDRVIWSVIPDAATAAAAMQRNEADWWEQPVFDLLPVLRRAPDLRFTIVEVLGNVGILRFNHLFPPFDNPAVRRALLGAVDQQEYMDAVVGDEKAAGRTGTGFFTPGTPMANDAGLEALRTPRDQAAVKRALAAAGYKNEPVVVMTPTDYPRIDALSNVAADMLRRCGLNVDLQAMDWGTVIQRRNSKAPPSQGGWNAFVTTQNGSDLSNPAVSTTLRANGAEAWSGWPDIPVLERLRLEWLAQPGLEGEQRVARDFQQQAFQDPPFLPLGQFFQPTVQHRSLTGNPEGLALFWGLRRA